MLIEIKDLELHPIDFEEEFRPGELDLGPDLQQKTALHAAGRAQLIEEHHGKHERIKDIRVSGELSTSLELLCARCLEPVTQDVSRKFDLLYRPLGADAGREELVSNRCGSRDQLLSRGRFAARRCYTRAGSVSRPSESDLP